MFPNANKNTFGTSSFNLPYSQNLFGRTISDTSMGSNAPPPIPLLPVANTMNFGSGANRILSGLSTKAPIQPYGLSQVQKNQGFSGLGTSVAFKNVIGCDTVQKNGTTYNVSTKFNFITSMKEYEGKSFEELRFEDYQCSPKAKPQTYGGTPTILQRPEEKLSLGGMNQPKQDSFVKPFSMAAQSGGLSSMSSAPGTFQIPSMSSHPPSGPFVLNNSQSFTPKPQRQPQTQLHNTHSSFKSTSSQPSFADNILKPNYSTVQANSQPFSLAFSMGMPLTQNQAIQPRAEGITMFNPPIINGTSDPSTSDLFPLKDLQTDYDLHTIVGQLYETFPHRKIFEGLSTTSSTKLKEPILVALPKEEQPMKIPPDMNQNRRKMWLLDNTVNQETLSGKFFLPNSKIKSLNVKHTSIEEVCSNGKKGGYSSFKHKILEELAAKKYDRTNREDAIKTPDVDCLPNIPIDRGGVTELDALTNQSHQKKKRFPCLTIVEEKTELERDIGDLERDIGDLEKNISDHGIKLVNPEYYTIPALDEITSSAVVQGFTIGRKGFGKIYFPGLIDISNFHLDEIVQLNYREVVVYPDDEKKPPIGEGLNRPAVITMENVWPKDHLKEDFLKRLMLLSEKQNAKLIDYHSDTGSWIFSVKHFTKYCFNDEIVLKLHLGVL